MLNNPSSSYETINASSMNSKLEINKKYGPVNVVSFTMKNIEGENVTLRESTSIAQYGETVIEIQDNPFMVNQNARELAISELYTSLVGFEYIPTVFNYKARLYNDCGDKIQVYDVDSEIYVNSLILNQTIVIPATRQSKMENQALSKTQVKNQYISKTEQEGSHTEIMVDKQNQQISSVVSQVTEQNSKISQINQRVDEISSQISDIADITTYGESSYAEVALNDINTSEPIMLKVHPTVTNISYLYPHSNLYPSSNTFMTIRTIRFENLEKYQVTQDVLYTGYKQYFSYDSQTEEYTLLVAGTDYTVGTVISTTVYEHKYVDYELPDDLLMYSQDVYDEFYLDYNSHTCQVTKRCAYNADGTVSELQSETTTDYTYPTIELEDGNYKISILGYQYGYIYVRLMAKNIYTDQFYTKSETNTIVNQTASDITLSVDQKLTNYSTTSEMNSAINMKAGEISSVVSTKVGKDEVISRINQSSESVTIDANKVSLNGKTINLTSDNIAINSTNFNVTKNGNVTANSLTSNNATITGGSVTLTSENGASGGETNFNIQRNGSYVKLKEYYNRIYLENETANVSASMMVGDASSGIYGSISVNGITGTDFVDISIGDSIGSANIAVAGNGSFTYIFPSYVQTPQVIQTSLEKEKKNFEKLEDALNIIRNIEIYKYNLKNEEDNIKKHIGFVIGNNFKYSKEVTSNENNGADIYSFVSVCCKAIQEQQQQIEELKKEIEKLKEG